MDRDILLACRDASLGYEHRALLEHLTFTVRAGDYLCVVGENGSGKSTLMKSLLGLLPPLVGTIDCPAQRAGAIGYLPQQTSAQRDFPATVSEVVLSGFANKRGLHFFYSAAEKSAALMNMGKLGVLELQNRCYRELSGGQQQRVLLARALCAAGEARYSATVPKNQPSRPMCRIVCASRSAPRISCVTMMTAIFSFSLR